MELSDIKKGLLIGDVLAHYNLQANRNQMLCCPFHADRTPSMQVYPDTNTVFCFSSNCSLHGKAIDSIDFILHKENCTKHEAILKAQALLGNVEAPKENLGEVFQTLRQALVKSKKAQEYLASRNLHDFKLEVGYNHYRTGFKQLQNCLVFPLKNRQNEIVSFYGRSIAPMGKHFYTANRQGQGVGEGNRYQVHY